MPGSVVDTSAYPPTALIADACLRLKYPFRVAPSSVRPVIQGSKLAGRVLPVRHYGSVDVFLEAMQTAEKGDVLVIDNGGRMDEACIGDLTVLEAKATGLKGMIVWGYHRDTEELVRIGFPVFSRGTYPAGPQRLDAQDPDFLESADLAGFTVNKQDYVVADDDGILFIPGTKKDEILQVARTIWKTERKQADAIMSGKKLRDQLQFDNYLKRRATDPDLTFRKHLQTIGGAIEE